MSKVSFSKLIEAKYLIERNKDASRMYTINNASLPSTLKPKESFDLLQTLYKNKLIDIYDIHEQQLPEPMYSELFKDFKESITDEEVLCIDRNLVNSLLYNNSSLEAYIKIVEDHKKYMPRRDVELSKEVLQIIPYMVVEHKNDFILLEKKKGDSRLINTIDFPAGHCNMEINDTIYAELSEELMINANDISQIEVFDIIPLVSNPYNVSHYHHGIIYIIKLKDSAIIVNNEPDKHNILRYYQDIDGNIEYLHKMGYWVLYTLSKLLKGRDKNE